MYWIVAQQYIPIDLSVLKHTTSSDTLGQILKKHGSDKSTNHNYHIIYNYILNELDTKKQLNVLEIGMGTNNPDIPSSMGVNGRPGASLRAFKEFLPNSHIYGADVDKDILFTEDRINTSYVDQFDTQSFVDMQNHFGNIKYDLIIDDGFHSISANLNTLIFGIQNIKVNGWVVIEDISKRLFEKEKNWTTALYILQQNKDYKVNVFETRSAYMICIHRLR